jgi:hypothetical protein
MDISVAFLVVAWLMVVGGLALWLIPVALVVGGVLLLVAGVALLPGVEIRRRSREASA